MKEKRVKTLNDCLRAIQDAYDVLEEVRDEEQEAYICRKMKNIPIIICITALMLSCGNKNKAQDKFFDQKEESSLISDEGKARRDSVGKKLLEDAAKVAASESSSIRRKTSRSGYSSDDDNEKEYDNMRGFDPASEDDMEDNGMSRYMENNDEEGWD
jgi:hypothetical protein